MILLIRKRTLLYTWLAVCMIGLSAIFLAGSRRAFTPTGAMGQGSSAQTVVIDPGHGGQDGGAVAGDGTEESRMKLAVSLQLEQLLRFAGVRTELTRREDVMVCDPGLKTMRQRKVSDLHNRASFVNGIPNAVLLSIHQNSLPSHPSTHGAQVFFNAVDPAGEVAQGVQQALNMSLDGGKTVKAMDGGVYLMKQIRCPGVLVECGFLSNDKEAAHLQTEEHQRRLAAAILAGLLQYSTKEG
mgnify:CR=1 FL=1